MHKSGLHKNVQRLPQGLAGEKLVKSRQFHVVDTLQLDVWQLSNIGDFCKFAGANGTLRGPLSCDLRLTGKWILDLTLDGLIRNTEPSGKDGGELLIVSDEEVGEYAHIRLSTKLSCPPSGGRIALSITVAEQKRQISTTTARGDGKGRTLAEAHSRGEGTKISERNFLRRPLRLCAFARDLPRNCLTCRAVKPFFSAARRTPRAAENRAGNWATRAAIMESTFPAADMLTEAAASGALVL